VTGEMDLKLFLTIVSGICWTLVYLDGIRLGIRDRSYAIPFYALALNITWELLQTFYGFQTAITAQTVINAVWFIFDLGILFTFFKYGRKYFPESLPASGFLIWSLLGLFVAFWVEFAFVREFGIAVGAGYSAFLQNLLMSVLFINMLIRRGNREGQSLTIAVSKWLGTLAPTILFGVLGEGGFPNGSVLILTLGIFCSVFDLLYIWMLLRMRPS
jgi:hypothetical protein